MRPAAGSLVDLGPVEALPDGRAELREANGRKLLLCRIGEQVYAVANRCTHAAWPLDGGAVVGCELVCELHGARFDVRDGSVTAPPASRWLQTFEVRICAGRIEVRVPPPPGSDG